MQWFLVFLVSSTVFHIIFCFFGAVQGFLVVV